MQNGAPRARPGRISGTGGAASLQESRRYINIGTTAGTVVRLTRGEAEARRRPYFAK